MIISVLMVASCGGGGSPNTSVEVAAHSNAVKIKVNSGVRGDYINGLFTSVTICPPSRSCFDIDNILVDTGSTGLRILASAVPSGSPIFNRYIKNGKYVGECSQFVSGVMWGPMAMVDVKLNGETASNIPVQIMGDNTFNAVPAECAARGAIMNSIQTLAANGILGISNFIADCGMVCVSNSNNGLYYGCAANSCEKIALSEDEQIQNPVAHFVVNNNGSVIVLPEVPGNSAESAEGKLIFGINTQRNNQLLDVRSVSLNQQTASFSTIYSGRNYSASYFDTGSNAIYFDDLSIAQCSGISLQGYYCPLDNITLNVILQGIRQECHSFSFAISNAERSLQSSTLYAVQPYLAGIAGGSGQDFVWGLPFYFGKTFFTAIENKSISSDGIFIAYR